MKKVTAVLIGVAGQFKAYAGTTIIWGIFLLGLLGASQFATAQSNVNEEQGLKPYDSSHGGDLDSVSLTSGSLALHVPLASFPQRGSLDLSFMLAYSSKQWYVRNKCVGQPPNQTCSWSWLPQPRSGALIASSLDWFMQSSSTPDAPGIDWSQSVTSPDGNSHQFGSGIASSGPTYPLRSKDSTGLLRPDFQTLILPNGTRYSYPNLTPNTSPGGLANGGVQASTVTDANGNQITINSSGWIDTLGRTIPGSVASSLKSGIQPGVPTSDLSKCPAGTSSAQIWSVPGVAGVNSGVRTFYFCYSMFTLSTNFSSGGTNYGPASTSLLSAIVLPDLTMWTLSYDNYGDITHLGFPTGGSISYTYTVGPTSCGSGATQTSMWVASRTVDANDGAGGRTWKYTYSGKPTSTTVNGQLIWNYSGQAVVTSPDGNDTVHTITNPVNGADCSLFDVQIQHYQGAASNGTLLRTEQTQYSGVLTYSNDGELAANVVVTQSSVTFPGGQTSKVANTYDSLFTNGDGEQVRIGSLLQRDEYDFSNALLRSTLNHYLWQDNATYKSSNFVGLPVSTTLKDGAGNQMAQTTYGYDQYGAGQPAASGITTGLVSPPAGGSIRGNATTVSHWLNTTNSFLSGAATYFDTGMKASSTDPKNNVTTYTYASSFAGAYITQTNMPDTQMPDTGAPIVHHVISGNYDFNTGLLTSFTDENSHAYSYQYDVMLRLTQGNHPDGGQTLFSYPNPTQVERQRLISGTTYDDYKVNFDGLGRPVQTQHPTPSGTILTDTTYDVVGRPSTVSNPYYQGSTHSSDPTYGVITTQYDALSRATKTIKQDGSFSTVQYNAPAGDGAGSSVVCTTAVDEAGKQRQVCTDALGRMVKVLEPNPGAAGTSANGWISIGGSEQTVQSQPAKSASVTVTLGGSEVQNSYQVCTTICRTYYINDTGTVQFSVNAGGTIIGPVSTTYGSTSTPATLAASLYSNFPSNAQVTMSNPNGGTSFTLTSIPASSSANNWTISASVTSGCDPNTYSCNGPGFWISPTAANFTGGQNAATASDSGTVTATINGTGYQVSYGSGDTTSTIASRLAAAINAGSYASALASGSTINLTSKTIGTTGDYSLSASYTWNSSQFINPSFTTSTSGSSLSGALDAGALNNNPYVTLYQYNARGDMLCVHQKATDTSADVACTGSAPPSVPAAWRQRFFTYDSLSRLLSALNPESGQINYAYDNNGNMTSKTAPAPNQTGTATVTTSVTYDALNRALDKTYSDGTTASASFRYDYSTYGGTTIQNPIGRLVVTLAAAQANGGYLMSYDPMGRVIQTYQQNPGAACCMMVTAGYDKLGDVTTVGYPSNAFSITYQYDAAARQTSATDSNGVIYAQNPTILASGAMQEFVSPNFNNNKFHSDYNSRLQPTEIWAGSSAGASALFDKKYTYNAPNTSQMNNGNIYTVTNVKDDSRTQSFTYDALNRLLSAGDKTHWSNTYVYDAWGNLYQKNPGSPAGENLIKVADTNNRLNGMSYDAAGNVTNDGTGNTFVYDAGNRTISATNNGVTTTYTYDAFGRRIKKTSGAIATYYWFGPGGETLSETDASGNFTHYIFFGGQRLARNVPQPSPNPVDIKYYITDHLHSTAVFADKSGTVLDDNDFYPWGGAVPSVGTTSTNNHYKFTGKERDAESQLDYFGARYYANITGRFMTPDWAAKPTSVPYAEFGDPQSLNLYSYVRNSPVVRVDADGHTPAVWDTPFVPNVRGGIQWGWGSKATDGAVDQHHEAEQQSPQQEHEPGAPHEAADGHEPAEAQGSEEHGQPSAAELTIPQLGYTTSGGGPGFGTWLRSWQLSEPSIQGGHIVQHITITDTGGFPVNGGEYWEAFPVEPNSDTSIKKDFFQPGGQAAMGYTVTAEARFHEGLTKATLEAAGFKTPNIETMAGTLLSTTKDPHLPLDNASNNVKVTWTVPQ